MGLCVLEMRLLLAMFSFLDEKERVDWQVHCLKYERE